MIKDLAVYTTIYPGVEPYLADWYASVRQQTDQDFRLWIGLDELSPDTAREAMGADPNAVWVEAPSGETPAQIRQRALSRVVESCDAVVLVDSDDLLHPSRVAAARNSLWSADLTGCALRLVDQGGLDLGFTFTLAQVAGPETVFPRHNVFGLSNSAFRSHLLKNCLPIPAEAALVDWFLATRAWLLGASLSFDREVRMDYRQHGANMVRVLPPFSVGQVVSDTERVRHHFRLLMAATPGEFIPGRMADLERAAADVEGFHQAVILQPGSLNDYVEALNALNPKPLWWVSVGHPLLRHMWS